MVETNFKCDKNPRHTTRDHTAHRTTCTTDPPSMPVALTHLSDDTSRNQHHGLLPQSLRVAWHVVPSTTSRPADGRHGTSKRRRHKKQQRCLDEENLVVLVAQVSHTGVKSNTLLLFLPLLLLLCCCCRSCERRCSCGGGGGGTGMLSSLSKTKANFAL